MQNNKFHYCLHILPILFFMAFVSASCIKDDLSDCPAPRTSGFSLPIKERFLIDSPCSAPT